MNLAAAIPTCPLSSIHFSRCPLFPSSSASSYLFHFSLTFPFILSICLSLSTRLCITSSSFCLPFCHLCPSQLRLLNKCISHVVELIHRSFSSAPYGPTVTLHKVFKDLVLKHILFPGRHAISSNVVCDTTSSPPTSAHILYNTPQELEKRRRIISALTLPVPSGDVWQSSLFKPWMMQH